MRPLKSGQEITLSGGLASACELPSSLSGNVNACPTLSLSERTQSCARRVVAARARSAAARSRIKCVRAASSLQKNAVASPSRRTSKRDNAYTRRRRATSRARVSSWGAQPEALKSDRLFSVLRPLFEPEPSFGSEPQGRRESRRQTEWEARPTIDRLEAGPTIDDCSQSTSDVGRLRRHRPAPPLAGQLTIGLYVRVKNDDDVSLVAGCWNQG